MAEWKPVWIARSDGEHEIKTKKNGRELNAPTSAQLDRNSGENDYYELLDIDDPVAIEWKRILGGMLHREQKGPTDQIWILVDFPENYRLYKRFKDKKDSKPRASDLPKPTKADGKDGSKSEDYYLYGYPLGHKKRFKSAVDFFPHLLWLAQGTSKERMDCECKQCSPEWVQTVSFLPGKGGFIPKTEPAAVQKDNPAVLKDNMTPRPQVVIKQRSLSQDSNKLSKSVPKSQPPASKAPASAIKGPAPASAPAPAPAAKAVPPAPKMASAPPKVAQQPANTSASRTAAPIPNLLAPTPLPLAKSLEQDQDAQYGKYIYRPGELTWFNRGSAWGLSVIIKRDLFKDQRGQDRPRYLVQPLSHPFSHPTTKIISSEDDLRPWLAWSAPGPTHQALATSNHDYKGVNWKEVVEGRYGVGDAEVDGSIFAAKMIDDSFTLIEPLSNNTTTTGERSYNGIFFGGEKLWVGEPVRLRVGHGHDVMIIHQIIEKLKQNSTSINSASVFIAGDIYRYTTVPYIVGQEPPENPNLPMRLRQDLNYRNRVSIASKRTISYWKLYQAPIRLGITDIKGRWYESSILLPILHGAAAFQQDVQRGDITDVGTWINGRGDANSAPGKAGTRCTDRLEAFGKAVPAGTRISKGLDGPAEENLFPAAGMTNPSGMQPVAAHSGLQGNAGQGQGQGQGQGHGQQQQQHVQQHGLGVGDGDIEQFMDMDRIEEGFNQNYVGGQY